MEKLRILNQRWIIGVLTAVVICLMTAMWANVQIVNEHISFAATLMSLLLSILAIVYAFISNSQFSNNIAALKDAASSSTGAAHTVNEATSRLETVVEQLPTALARVEMKMDSMHQVFVQGFSGAAKHETDAVPKSNESDVDKVVKGGSLHGLAGLYAVGVAFDKNGPNSQFNLDDVSKINKFFNSNYMMGYMVACATYLGGVLDIDGTNVTVITFPSSLPTKIRKELNGRKADKEYLVEVGDTNATNIVSDTLKSLDAIDVLFEKK